MIAICSISNLQLYNYTDDVVLDEDSLVEVLDQRVAILGALNIENDPHWWINPIIAE